LQFRGLPLKVHAKALVGMEVMINIIAPRHILAPESLTEKLKLTWS